MSDSIKPYYFITWFKLKMARESKPNFITVENELNRTYFGANSLTCKKNTKISLC